MNERRHRLPSEAMNNHRTPHEPNTVDKSTPSPHLTSNRLDDPPASLFTSKSPYNVVEKKVYRSVAEYVRNAICWMLALLERRHLPARDEGGRACVRACARARPSTRELFSCSPLLVALGMSGNALERLSSETTDSALSAHLYDDSEGQDAVDKTPLVVVSSMNNADGWLVALRWADSWALRQWLAQGRVLPHEASYLCNRFAVLRASSDCEGVRPTAPGLGFPEELRTPRGAAWVLLAAAPDGGARSPRPDLAETLDHIVDNLPRYRHLLNKIEQDVPRTFQGADEVRQRVSPEALVRVLSALAVYNNNLYLQGMNLYAAAFLYVLPEPEAFNLLTRLIDIYAPRYFQVNTLAGAHDGCKLAAQLLQSVDAELANHLSEDPLGLERLLLVHGFPAILSLSLSIPPFEDALTLLDWILAFGAHFGVVFLIARLRCAREQLLRRSVSTKQVLNPRRRDEMFYIPPQAIVRESLALISQLSSEFWEQLQQHPFGNKPSRSNFHESSVQTEERWS